MRVPMMCGGVVRIELDGAAEFLLTSRQIPDDEDNGGNYGGILIQGSYDRNNLENEGYLTPLRDCPLSRMLRTARL